MASQAFVERMERQRREKDEAFQEATEEFGLFRNDERLSRILWDFSYQENHGSGFNDVNAGYAELLSLMEQLDVA